MHRTESTVVAVKVATPRSSQDARVAQALACDWTSYISALFCHPDPVRLRSGQAPPHSSPERSRRGFLSASFQANRFAIYLQRAWQPVQIGFSQPRTPCPQSLRVDSSASLGMTQQANAPQRINPHSSKCRNSSRAPSAARRERCRGRYKCWNQRILWTKAPRRCANFTSISSRAAVEFCTSALRLTWNAGCMNTSTK